MKYTLNDLLVQKILIYVSQFTNLTTLLCECSAFVSTYSFIMLIGGARHQVLDSQLSITLTFITSKGTSNGNCNKYYMIIYNFLVVLRIQHIFLKHAMETEKSTKHFHH